MTKNKTLLLLVFAAATMAFPSCGNKAQTTPDTPADSVKTDSIAPDTAATVQEAEKAAPAYLSDDLKAFGLKGQVKTCSGTSYGQDTGAYQEDLRFSPEGKLKNKHSDHTFKKNKEGFICKVTTFVGDGEFVMTYSKFNENGHPLQAKDVSDIPFVSMESDIAYTYTAFDDHGNWTERKVRMTTQTAEMDEATGDYGTPKKSTQQLTQKRTISYYE